MGSGITTQATCHSVRVEAAAGAPGSLSTNPMDHDKVKADPSKGVLSIIIPKERPRTRQSWCSMTAVKDGRHNSDSFSDEENDGMARGEQKDNRGRAQGRSTRAVLHYSDAGGREGE